MVRLSKHTLDEMGARGITSSYIDQVLAQPDRSMPDPVRPGLTRSFRAIAEFGGRVLRVVHRPDGEGVFVVTAHWDGGAGRR